VNDSVYGPERSITYYVAAETAESEQQTAPLERNLIVWAVLALTLVLLGLLIGGCA